MTTPKAVSPDFAAMAREITGPCTCHEAFTVRGREDPGCAWHNYAPEIETALTLSHAAGRAEGLTEAAKARAELSRLLSTTKLLMAEVSDPGTEAFAAIWCAEQLLFESALASDPVVGDQVADVWSEKVNSVCRICGGTGGTLVRCENCAGTGASVGGYLPAPAPGLAAQEVERVKEALYLALRAYQLGEQGDNRTAVGALTLALSAVFLAVDAALSAPRPAQAVRHASTCPFAASNGCAPTLFKCNCDYELRMSLAQAKEGPTE